MGRGKVVADLVVEHLTPCGQRERGTEVCDGSGSEGHSCFAWPACPPSLAELCSLAPGQQQAQQVFRVWWGPVVEPAYINQAVSKAAQFIGDS